MKHLFKSALALSLLMTSLSTTAFAANTSPIPSLTKTQSNCLKKEGIDISTNRPPKNLDPAKFQKSMTKCGVSLSGFMPSGAAPKIDTKEFKSFQSCLKKYKIDGSNPMALDQSDPTTAAALVTCQKSSGFKIPTFGGNSR